MDTWSYMNSKKYIIIFLVPVLYLASCTSTKKFVYFPDLEKINGTQNITNFQSIKVQPGDILQITITTIDRDITALLNPAPGNTSAPGYLVDSIGDIELPLAGKIPVQGKTLPEVDNTIKAALSKTVKNLFVSTRLLNFRISILGAVQHAGSFSISNDRVTILDALSLAGDLNGAAKLNDIMVIRERAGKREYVSLDLNNSKTMSSPYFYLANNDVIYVRPASNKLITNTTGFQLLPTIFGSISLLLVIYGTFRR